MKPPSQQRQVSEAGGASSQEFDRKALGRFRNIAHQIYYNEFLQQRGWSNHRHNKGLDIFVSKLVVGSVEPQFTQTGKVRRECVSNNFVVLTSPSPNMNVEGRFC